MTEPTDWSLASFAGNRRAQHVAFLALPFREKLIRLEQMAEVERRLRTGRTPGVRRDAESGGAKER